MTRMLAIDSRGGVSVGVPRSTAAQNASSWYSYVGVRGNRSTRLLPPAVTFSGGRAAVRSD